MPDPHDNSPSPMEPQDIRAASVRHGYAMGWSFTPLAGKKPIHKGWPSAPRESLDEALTWAARGNIGLRTGLTSRVVVIDADKGADLLGLELPHTVTAKTGGDGLHLYFTCTVPLGNSTGKLGPHIDVRGDGGQVVFPGSVHPDTGRLYQWDRGAAPWEVPLADLPEHIVDLLRASPATKSSSEESVSGESATTRPVPTTPPCPSPSRSSSSHPARTPPQRYATAALLLELNAIHRAQEGSRNDTLNRSSFSLGTLIGADLLGRSEVEQSLLEAAEKVGLSREEAEATIRSGIESGMKHPRQVPTRDDTVQTAGAENGETPSPHSSSFSHLPSPQDVPALPPGRFRLDLYGNADRFMHLFGQDVHWCENRGKWYVWDGRCWKTDAIRDMHRLAELTMLALVREGVGDLETLKWAIRCSKGAKPAHEMLDVVKHRSAITLDSLDRQPWLLGVDNGVIDLKTGELLLHDRAHLITTLSPAQYDADAPCPRWEKFLLEIMDGTTEMVAALQRLAG